MLRFVIMTLYFGAKKILIYFHRAWEWAKCGFFFVKMSMEKSFFFHILYCYWPAVAYLHSGSWVLSEYRVCLDRLESDSASVMNQLRPELNWTELTWLVCERVPPAASVIVTSSAHHAGVLWMKQLSCICVVLELYQFK